MATADYSSIFTPSSSFGSSSFGKYTGSSDFWKNYKTLPASSSAQIGLPSFSAPTSGTQSGTPGTTPTDGAVPSIYPSVDASIEYQRQMLPILQQALQQSNQATLAYNQAAMQQAYPFISQAASEATQRNLAASEAFTRFKEQQPSNVQNIMASKQTQAYNAASAEALRQQATAAQQDAATRFARNYAGKTFQTS